MLEIVEAEVRGAAGPCEAAPAPGSCAACAAHAAAEDDYAAHAFDAPLQFSRTVEAIVDTLGFCAAHGELVADSAGRGDRVAKAVLAAVERLAAMLADEATYGDRLGGIFFRAGRDCPACRHVERAAAASLTELQRAAAPQSGVGSYARLRHLCFLHFKRLYLGGSGQQREAWLAHYRDDLVRALSAQAAAAPDAAINATGGPIQPLLNRVAGEGPRRSGTATTGIAPARATSVTAALPELLEGDACPVCREVAAARARWLNAVRLTLRNGQPAWLSFPSCAEHVHAVVALGDAAATGTAARHAGEAALSILERRLPPFTAPERAADSAEPLPPRRWRGSKALRRKEPLVDAKWAKRPHARTCVACEQLAIARDAAVGRLVDALHHEMHRSAYARGYGLCMRHFAQAYLLAGGSRWRSFLTEIQVDRLRHTHAALAASLDPGTRKETGLPSTPGLRQAVALALARLGGNVVAAG